MEKSKAVKRQRTGLMNLLKVIKSDKLKGSGLSSQRLATQVARVSSEVLATLVIRTRWEALATMKRDLVVVVV